MLRKSPKLKLKWNFGPSCKNRKISTKIFEKIFLPEMFSAVDKNTLEEWNSLGLSTYSGEPKVLRKGPNRFLKLIRNISGNYFVGSQSHPGGSPLMRGFFIQPKKLLVKKVNSQKSYCVERGEKTSSIVWSNNYLERSERLWSNDWSLICLERSESVRNIDKFVQIVDQFIAQKLKFILKITDRVKPRLKR